MIIFRRKLEIYKSRIYKPGDTSRILSTCTQIPYTVCTIPKEHRRSIACWEMCLIYPLLKIYSYRPNIKLKQQTNTKGEKRQLLSTKYFPSSGNDIKLTTKCCHWTETYHMMDVRSPFCSRVKSIRWHIIIIL